MRRLCFGFAFLAAALASIGAANVQRAARAAFSRHVPEGDAHVPGRPHARIISNPGVLARTLSLFAVLASPALAGQGDNLPVYTSPIDITGLRLQFQAVAPNIDGAGFMNVPIPGGVLGPKMTQLLATPLSAQFDQFWALQRVNACDGTAGIRSQVQAAVKKIGSSYDSYDVSCNLALTGRLLVQQVGSYLYVAYLLTGNTVEFAVTSPTTCRSDNGTFLCPNDPRFKVTFATEIVTLVHAPDACHITSEGGTVYSLSVNIDEKNVSGAIAVAVDDLFLGHKFTAAEQAIGAVTKLITLPLDAGFKELREADGCTGKNPLVSRELVAFRDFDVIIDLRAGVIFQLGHAGIATPTVYGPSFGVSSQPTFIRPMIATPQPIVIAGTSVQVTGQYFPTNVNLATALPIGLYHGGYGTNSVLLSSGVCLRGLTILESGLANQSMTVTALPGDAQGYCANSYYAANLTPETTYQFRARDCDEITCSPWSTLLKVTTARLDPGVVTVVLTLDGAALGSTSIDALGKFNTVVTIPASTPAGTHTIHAVNRDRMALVGLQVAAASGGGKALVMVVGVLKGEQGCPNHPLASTQTDSSFMVFGAGFAPGVVILQLDSVTGFPVGSATAGSDGIFCQEMPGVPATLAGTHALSAVQNGIVQAQTTVGFVLASGVR